MRMYPFGGLTLATLLSPDVDPTVVSSGEFPSSLLSVMLDVLLSESLEVVVLVLLLLRPASLLLLLLELLVQRLGCKFCWVSAPCELAGFAFCAVESTDTGVLMALL